MQKHDLENIKAFIFDIDGVLTDATIHVTETGEQLRRFNVRDGYAIQFAIKKGYYVFAISGGKSHSVVLRLRGLGVTDIHLGVDEKIIVYREIISKYGLHPHEILYMGDDIPDIPVMKMSGLSVCPKDASEEVKKISQYISEKGGGEGCVRDIISLVLKQQNKWYNDISSDGENITSI